jgi:hypothetical protein
MKSYVASSSDPANPEKFLAYMVPQPGEVCITCDWIPNLKYWLFKKKNCD